MTLRPFWRYYGGKWLLARRYPAPRHAVIVEPFAGAAGYSCHYADRCVVLVDKNPVVAGIWRLLIHGDPDVVRACPDVPVDGSTADLPDVAGLRDLAGFWLSNGLADPRRSHGTWGAQYPSRVGWTQRIRDRIADQMPHIRHWTIIEGDYTDAHRAIAPDTEATWFVDPPYASRAGRRYKYQPVHADLGAWCTTRRGQVIACDAVGAPWGDFAPLGVAAGFGLKNRASATLEGIWLMGGA